MSTTLPPDVLEALENGRTIDAIKRLRKHSKVGLTEAKAAIEAYARSRAGELATLKAPSVESIRQDAGRVLPDVVVEALQRGDKMAAVKLLRERTGLGLKAARERIEAAGFPASGFPEAAAAARQAALPHLNHRIDPPRDQLAPRANGLAPGEVPRSNGAFWLVLLLLAAIAGYYLM
jgi:ribosomal protein L7/L12